MSQVRLNQEFGVRNTDSRWRNLYRVGGTAAWIVAVLFSIAIFDLATGNAILSDNVLMLIFKLHMGIGGVQVGDLDGLNVLDVSILLLVGMMSLALYPPLKRVNKVWATVAAALPFVGLTLFIITQGIGRSGILLSGLILAILILSSDSFSKMPAYTGIVAHVFLMIGDFGTAFSYTTLLGTAIGIGYLFFVIWCGLIGWELIRLGWDKPARAPE